MRPLAHGITLASLLALATTSGVAIADSAPDAAIQYRQAVMKAVGGNTKGLAMIVKGEVPFTDNLANHARGLANASQLAGSAFKQNTHGQGSEKTTAKENIWTEWSKFEAGLKKLQEASAKLAELAEAGDAKGAAEQLGAVGKTCKGCHDDFRTK